MFEEIVSIGGVIRARMQLDSKSENELRHPDGSSLVISTNETVPKNVPKRSDASVASAT